MKFIIGQLMPMKRCCDDGGSCFCSARTRKGLKERFDVGGTPQKDSGGYDRFGLDLADHRYGLWKSSSVVSERFFAQCFYAIED